jgi:acetyl esterase/lipase
MFKIIFCLLSCILTKVCYTQTVTWKNLDSLADNYIQNFTYAQLPDTTLKVWYIQTPKKKNIPKQTAIIWIHGGAWVGGKASTFFANAAYCSINNAVGFSIEYRLLNQPEYNINDCISDCANAITSIKKRHKELNIDTNKIVLVGESAGGHLAAMLALQQRHRFKALILYNPVLNCHTGTFIKYMHTPLLLSKQPVDSTQLLVQYKEKAIALSPLYQVKNTLPPTLIVQGLNDKVTPANYAIAFKDSLESKHKSCTLKLLPNTGHAFAIAHYKASEEQVIQAMQIASHFLQANKLIYLKHPLRVEPQSNWFNNHRP